MAAKKSNENRKKSPAKSGSSTSRGGTGSRRASGSRGSGSRASGTSGGKSGRSSRSRPSSATRSRLAFSLNARQKALIVGIFLIFFTAVLVLSLLSPNQGQMTTALAGLLWRTFGWGGVAVPIALAAGGFYLVLWGMEQQPALPGRRLVGLLLLFLTLEALASLLLVLLGNDLPDVWAVARAQQGGGYLGGAVASLVRLGVGNLGAIIVLAVLGIASTVLLTGVTLQELAGLRELATPTRRDAAREAAPLSRGPGRAAPAASQPPLRLGGENAARAGSAALGAPPEAAPSPGRRGRRGRSTAPSPSPVAEPAGAADDAVAGEGGEPMPIFLGSGSGPQIWNLPSTGEMLDAGMDQESNDLAIRQHVEIIEQTLASFGAPASVVEISQGPTITQYGVEPQFIEGRGGKRTKVKVGKIASLADDLALALAARSIRIQAPVPGKGYVGIEVPNPTKSLVSLRDVMESDDFGRLRGPLRIGLGQNVAGQAIVADLARMPHLLIAGATGSGKSVCVNSIVACFLLTHTPDDLRFVMVDPKRVELVGYNGIPHLVAPVVVDLERVVGTLQWAMREMENRYQKLAELGVRNIGEYNRKVAKRQDREKMPYIVILIDELADLMMQAPEDTEKSITRLAQMSRATGIHMIIATQRPSVDVVTGLIKANFPARIAFAVASGTDSRVILDTTGAERLLGQGDMLFQSPDAAAPVRMQGCFVSDRELSHLIGHWQNERRQNLMRLRGPIGTGASSGDGVVQATGPAVDDGKGAAAPPQRDMTPAQAGPPTQPEEKKAASPAAAPAPAPSRRRPAPPEPAPTPASEAVPAPAAANAAPADDDEAASLPSPLQQPLWEDLIPDDEDEGYDDDLVPEAIELVRRLKKASTSLLQRRFRIGYTRAARIMDVLEEQGIIGPPTGTSKAREVLPLADAGSAEQEPEASP